MFLQEGDNCAEFWLVMGTGRGGRVGGMMTTVLQAMGDVHGGHKISGLEAVARSSGLQNDRVPSTALQ